MDLDELARAHLSLQRAVDRQAFDVDLGVDLGRVAQDQLASRRNLALELPVDAKRLLERELAFQVAALVQEAVQSGALAAWFHR